MAKAREAADLVRGEFTRQARQMAVGRTFHAEGAIEPFVRLLGTPSPRTVLDLACGPGIVTAALAKVGMHVMAVDLTPEMIRLARDRCRREGVLDVEFQIGDAAHLPFEDERLPAAVTRLSVHHFPNPALALGELRRVLREGAVLVLGDITCSSDPVEAELHNALETLRDPSHRRLLPEEEFVGLLESSGFRIESREQWANPKTFDEWAAIVADARSMAPVRVVMRELARTGRTAGIDLRMEGDAIRFVHHWCFLRAIAC